MLKQRIITGLIFLAIIFAVLFYAPPLILVGFLVLVCTVAGWEWANFAHITHPVLRILYAVAIAVVIGCLVYVTNLVTDQTLILPVRDILGAGCMWWAIALLWVMSYPASSIYWQYPFMKMLMGIFVLVPSAIALIYLVSLPAGIWLFLYVVGIVVTADVGGYVFGRWLGKSKLAPLVSPGKSWAGFWGGLLSTLFYAAIVGSQYAVAGLSFWSLLTVTGFAALASVLGDLLESMLKRERGIKDSSQLLPGHGGFMDRIDSITAAAPVFTLLVLLLQAAG